jgi:hypothetical protein
MNSRFEWLTEGASPVLMRETERNFIFEITNWNTQNIIHHSFGDVSSIRFHLNIGGKDAESCSLSRIGNFIFSLFYNGPRVTLSYDHRS